MTGNASPELVAVGTAAGGVAGNLATELCKTLHRPVAERWLEARSGIDENHHVASALRLAQLAGLRVILTEFDNAWPSDWDDARRIEAGRFSSAMKQFLEDDAAEAKQARFGSASPLAADEQRIRDEVVATLPDLVDDSLALRRASGDDLALREGLAQLRRATETAVLSELRLRTGSQDHGLPDAFVQAFDGTGLPNAWFDLFVRDAAFRLKQDASFERVWNAEQLALVKAIAAAQRAVLSEINERTIRIEQAQAQGHAAILAAIHALGVPLPVLRGILEGFGERAAEMDAAQLEQTLRAKAVEYQELRNRLSSLTNDDPRVQALRQKAGEQIGAGDFAAADVTLSQAELLDLAVVEELESAAQRRRASAAVTRAERAAAARLRLDYRTEAAHYHAAAEIVARDAAASWAYRLREASSLDDHGREFGDNQALRDAIALYRTTLALAPRAERPDDWATTQNNLGNALQTLGERETGTARLEEAVNAFRDALLERTRDRVPLDWAMTQNNLGIALKTLGERESGTARLQQAVNAYRDALRERTRDGVPLDWAATQNNLGNALSTLGARETGTARLDEAVNAYRDALLEYKRERVPLDWAMTQNNLGNALTRLGARETDTARLEQAVNAYRDALRERTRDRVPLDWAATQNNLGNALRMLGERESGTARLEEAVNAYRDALLERTRERVPLDWATTHNNLGAALQTLGERETGTARLEEAVNAYRDALLERTRDRVPLDWAMTQNNLGIALWRLGERESGTARLEQAVNAYRDALRERTRDRVPLDWAATQNNLGNALRMLGERETDTARLEQAVNAYRDALRERTRDRVPLDWAATQNNLGNALQTLGARETGTARLEAALTAWKACLTVAVSAWPAEWVLPVQTRIHETQAEIARRNET